MEYCASAASMLAEEFWQIAEGFVEVQNVESNIYKVESAFHLLTNFHNVESMLTKLPHFGKFAKKTSTMWKVGQQNFHHVERVITKPPQCVKLPQCGT